MLGRSTARVLEPPLAGALRAVIAIYFLSPRNCPWHRGSWGMLTCCTCSSSWRSTRSICSCRWTSSCSSRLSSWSSVRCSRNLVFAAARPSQSQGELGDAHVLHQLEQLEVHALDMLSPLDLELLEPA